MTTLPAPRRCSECGSPFPPGAGRGRPPSYCSKECRRAARSAYEERRAAAVFAAGRVDPDTIPVPGLPSLADDLRVSLTDADGIPAYGPPEDDRSAYLAARRAYLDTLADTRRGWTRTAGGWSVPEVGGPCAGCPILALPLRREVTDQWERDDQEAARRRAIIESLTY